LNGTVVNCMDPGNSMSTASTTIQIIDTSNGESTAVIKYYQHMTMHSTL
jgi:hypothetical protein